MFLWERIVQQAGYWSWAFTSKALVIDVWFGCNTLSKKLKHISCRRYIYIYRLSSQLTIPTKSHFYIVYSTGVVNEANIYSTIKASQIMCLYIYKLWIIRMRCDVEPNKAMYCKEGTITYIDRVATRETCHAIRRGNM